MHLQAGQKLSFYEILGELGRGGMGEVYRALDTRLDREVALKVLPPAFVEKEERLRRFEREAKLLAALNHPNVGGIHGIDQVGNICFLSLELVHGETLAERLARETPSVDEALRLADQIAAGLEAAHAKGIVHRDLKPANVMITSDGVVKLLDFGLAKATDPDSDVATAHESVVITEAGRIFGTPHYMSPEQVDGSEAQTKSDIWAFGCLLYEMLVGKRAFDGPNLTAVLARVSTDEPDWDAVPDATPADIVRLLHETIRRDTETRLSRIDEARERLDQTLRPPAKAGNLRLLALGALALVGVIAIVISTRPEPRSVTLDLTDFASSPDEAPQLSPDGRLVLFRTEPGLRVRDIGSGETHLVPKTEQAEHAFWSPDALSIGFVRDRTLIAVTLADGFERLIARLGEAWGPRAGAAWLHDGSIVYTAGHDGSLLWRVPEGSQDAEQFLKPNALEDVRHFHQPRGLPGKQPRVLVGLHRTGDRADALAIASQSHAQLIWESDSEQLDQAFWSAPKTVVFGTRSENGPHRVWSMSVDLDREKSTDERVLLAGPRRLHGASPKGWLSSGPTPGPSELVWLESNGEVGAALRTAHGLRNPKLNNDGSRAALTVEGPDGDELWVYDFNLGSKRILGPAPNGSLSWSAGGSQIAYADGEGQLILQDTVERLASERFLGNAGEPAFSRDKMSIVFVREDDLWSMDLRTAQEKRLTSTPARESQPSLSPDGRYLAYVSTMPTGSTEVWVASMPGAEETRPASDGPGTMPRWSAAGDELFFVRDGRLFAVRVSPGETTGGLEQFPSVFSELVPREHLPGTGITFEQGFDVDPETGRFLCVRRTTPLLEKPRLILTRDLDHE